MRILLDTQAFLFATLETRRFSDHAMSRMSSSDSELLLSDVSCWEVAIKVAIGRLSIEGDITQFFDEQAREMRLTPLPISRAHVLYVATLPLHHRDPFDRLLVAHSLHERVPLVSNDHKLDDYGIERIW